MAVMWKGGYSPLRREAGTHVHQPFTHWQLQVPAYDE